MRSEAVRIEEAGAATFHSLLQVGGLGMGCNMAFRRPALLSRPFLQVALFAVVVSVSMRAKVARGLSWALLAFGTMAVTSADIESAHLVSASGGLRSNWREAYSAP